MYEFMEHFHASIYISAFRCNFEYTYHLQQCQISLKHMIEVNLAVFPSIESWWVVYTAFLARDIKHLRHIGFIRPVE